MTETAPEYSHPLIAGLRDQLAALNANASTADAVPFEKGDWCFLTTEEEKVFGIERGRWVYMLAVWQLYEAVQDICTDGLPIEVDEQALRDVLPWAGRQHMDIQEFRRFASLFDLTGHEAQALYEKDFWRSVREGLIDLD